MRIQHVHLGRSAYRNEYLQSEEWAELRMKILRRAPDGKCEKCLSSRATDVHHMDYRVLSVPGFETRNQLIALCRPCHELVEDAKKLKLLPPVHYRPHIRELTAEAVAKARKEHNRKFKWDEQMSLRMAAMQTTGQRLVCGILKRSMPSAFPLSFNSWLGITVTRSQKERIEKVFVQHIDSSVANGHDIRKLKHKIRDRERAKKSNWWKVDLEGRTHFKHGLHFKREKNN
jgi:5-methylcytosine-specific restriction endonuclease McrA